MPQTVCALCVLVLNPEENAEERKHFEAQAVMRALHEPRRLLHLLICLLPPCQRPTWYLWSECSDLSPLHSRRKQFLLKDVAVSRFRRADNILCCNCLQILLCVYRLLFFFSFFFFLQISTVWDLLSLKDKAGNILIMNTSHERTKKQRRVSLSLNAFQLKTK